MTVLILGGSSGLGRALVRRFARDGGSLLIVARDGRDLERVAADARVRNNARVSCLAGDVAAPESLLGKLEAALADLPPLTGILCVAGSVSDDDGIERPDLIAQLTQANFVGPCTIVAHLAPRVVKGGFVVGIGSIAAVRGRSRNSAYAAAKAALRLYFQSLRHALWRKLAVQFYVAGYIDTNLAFGRRLALPPVRPDAFADHIARQIARRANGDFYFPWYWRYVSLAVAMLPWRLFRGLNF